MECTGCLGEQTAKLPAFAEKLFELRKDKSLQPSVCAEGKAIVDEQKSCTENDFCKGDAVADVAKNALGTAENAYTFAKCDITTGSSGGAAVPTGGGVSSGEGGVVNSGGDTSGGGKTKKRSDSSKVATSSTLTLMLLLVAVS